MMTPRWQEYLAAQVLNEGNIINHRLLSRALKINSNIAKQMLYEFHRTQNARKPGSLHATYLLCGQRKPDQDHETNGTHRKDDEDVAMGEDSFMSSSLPGKNHEEEDQPEDIPVLSITLAREEHLEDVKEQYSALHSIHVYSLEPSELHNIQVISDCARRVRAEYATENPLETWKQYGTIHNPHAKRRTTPRAPAPLPAPAPTTSAMKPTKPTTASTTASSNRPASSGKDTTNKPTKTSSVSGAKPPALRRESSNLAKSFAKTKTAPTKQKEGSASSQSQSQSHAEDESMRDASDAEEEDLATALPASKEDQAETKKRTDAARQEKSAREQTLKKMMEDYEEEEEADDKEEEQDAIMQDSLAESQPAVAPEPEPEATTSVSVAGGRRRGRRRVMKKKTTKDAEGYLVTKEEPIWESFSEDERETMKKPVAARKESTAKSSLKEDGKGKKEGKPGQGNIMSFFAKR